VSENILESYLIRLGATTDTASFTKFHNVLKDAGQQVQSFTSGAFGGFVKLESAIVSTFAAAGVGLISLADKTALADQQFGLMGSRMLMTKNSFRAMQSATDALGVSLNDIVTDMTGELNNEFQDLYQRNLKLGKQLGTGFDSSMIGIRRLRVEFKQFETELEFLSYSVVGKLFEKLGFGSGDVLTTLRNFNDMFSSSLPGMADKVSSDLIPVWNDMKIILGGVYSNAKLVGLTFTNIVGTLSGDSAIKGTTFDLDKLAQAFIHAANAAVQFSNAVGFYMKLGGHVLSAGTSAAQSFFNVPGFFDTDPNHSADAASTKEFSAVVRDVRGLINPNLKVGNPDFADILKQHAGESQASAKPDIATTMINLAKRVSAQTGIPANLIYSQWAHETNGFSSNVFNSNRNAGGMRIPGSTDYQKFASLDQFADSYERLITSSRYTSQGITGAKNDRDFAGALKRGSYYEDTAANYAAGMHRWEPTFNGGGGDVVIQSMTINMPHAVTEDRMKSIISDSMSSVLTKRDRNTMAQTASGPHW
jgi:hypothetical protein